MTTINGKLIATERQELDFAKQQIADLQQQYEELSLSSMQWDRAKVQIERDISVLQQLQSKLNIIDRKNSTIDRQVKAAIDEINTTRSYLIGSIIGIICIFTGGLFWLGNTPKAAPAELPQLHNQELN